MNKESQNEPDLSTRSPALLKISARKMKIQKNRICQGDIFENIDVLESQNIQKDTMIVEVLSFPYVVCLNQECDLENDFKNNNNKDCGLLHLAIAPAFIFDQFLSGKHWGSIFKENSAQKRKDSVIRKVMDNEIPRYHYLFFPESDMPELIIDFKHFFTINRNILYQQLSKRLCSLDDLFKEKVSQRFSNYISRIGLPEQIVDS